MARLMKKSVQSTLWLLAVIILSAVVLSVFDRYQEEATVPPTSDDVRRASVYLIVYAGEDLPEGREGETFKKVGCEDLLVPYEIDVSSRRLKSVLHALSSFVPPEGYHNPLQEKGMIIDDVQDRGHSTVIVDFQGEPAFGGVCDTPRFMEQIRETVRLYHPDFEIRLNGVEAKFRCLSDMSGECK